MQNDLRTELTNAEGRLIELTDRLARLSQEAAVEEERVALLRRLLELSGESAQSPQTVTPGAAARPVARKPRLEDAVVAILSGIQGSLHVSELRQRLISDGIRIPGKGTDANIIARIIRDPRIAREKGRRGFYGLQR